MYRKVSEGAGANDIIWNKMKKILLLLFCLITCVSHAGDAVKIGYIGIPIHDQVLRMLTKDLNVAVINKQGGKGIIGYTALENREIDFLVVPNATAVLVPQLDKKLYDFMPVDRFRFVSYLALIDPVLLVAPRYTSMNNLIDSKKKTGETVFSAAIAEESVLLTDIYFKSKGVGITQVPYNGGGNTSIIDTLANRTDVIFLSEYIAKEFISRGATYIRFKDMPNALLNKVEMSVILLTRKDMPQETIDTLMLAMKRNYQETAELRKGGNISIPLTTEKETQIKLTEYGNLLSTLLNTEHR